MRRRRHPLEKTGIQVWMQQCSRWVSCEERQKRASWGWGTSDNLDLHPTITRNLWRQPLKLEHWHAGVLGSHYLQDTTKQYRGLILMQQIKSTGTSITTCLVFLPVPCTIVNLDICPMFDHPQNNTSTKHQQILLSYNVLTQLQQIFLNSYVSILWSCLITSLCIDSHLCVTVRTTANQKILKILMHSFP